MLETRFCYFMSIYMNTRCREYRDNISCNFLLDSLIVRMQVNMVFHIILFSTALFVEYTLGNNTRESVEGCKTTYTLGYGYKTIYHILEAGEHNDNNLTLRFNVKASSDAHIILSSTKDPTETDSTYEIVIGAGKNTFSVIRSQRRKYTREHVNTQNILSSKEYRGFWITLSPIGHLEVGKENEKAPFLFWDDPHPAVIRYFGFCNWANIIGQWAFSCPKDTQAEETNKNLTTLEKLRKDLLEHYDPYSRPVIQTTDITTVFLQVQNRAVRVDEKLSQMTVTADVNLQWQDQKLQWDPLLYDNISQIVIAYQEIWQPDIILYNAASSGSGFLAAEPMTVSPIGTVIWKTFMSVNVHCKLDLSKWPHDSQVCDLQLGYWAEQQYLRLLYSNEPTNNSQQTVSEWQIIDLNYLNVHIKTPWSEVSNIPTEAALLVRYKLQRKNYTYNAVFGVPLLVISIMTLFPFWISPLNINRLYISCLSLIIMGIFLICLGRTLPAPSDHVPSLVQTYSHGMVAVTFSIIISVAVIAMSRSNNTQPIPQIAKQLLDSKYIQLLLLLPSVPNKDSTEYQNLRENESGDNVSASTTNVNYLQEVQQQWILIAILIDRISFLLYTFYFGYLLLEQM